MHIYLTETTDCDYQWFNFTSFHHYDTPARNEIEKKSFCIITDSYDFCYSNLALVLMDIEATLWHESIDKLNLVTATM